MSFATLDEFKAFLRSTDAAEQISAMVGESGADDDILDRWLDEGAAWLAQKLAARYAVTEAAVAADDLLAVWFREANCLRAAWYGIGTHPKLAVPKGLDRAYADLLKTLDAVAAGEQALPGATPLPGSTTAASYPRAVGDERVMNTEQLGRIF